MITHRDVRADKPAASGADGPQHEAAAVTQAERNDLLALALAVGLTVRVSR